MKNTIPADMLEKLKKYPELEKSVNTYVETLKREKKQGLSIDALKVLESHDDVKPIEGLFRASVGADGDVPTEIMDVIGKYPEFETALNSYLRTMAVEKAQKLSVDAVSVMKSQEDVRPVEGTAASADDLHTELLEKLKQYPDVEEQLGNYLSAMKKEQEKHLSIHGVKVLDK